MKMMTDEQAYAAMFYFLDQLYQRTKSDYLGGLLGQMCMLQDGKTADPAVLHNWDKAVEYALKGGKPDSLRLG